MKINISLLFALLMVTFSHGKDTPKFPVHSAMTGLASPISLEGGTNTVYLEDYLLDVSKIDSISGDASLLITLSSNKKIVTLQEVGEAPHFSVIKIWMKEVSYCIPVKRSLKEAQEITFFPGTAKYGAIAIAGSMNGWDPKQSSMTYDAEYNKWSITMSLAPGSYQYQLVVDGKWMLDPSNEDTVSNGMGGSNSVMEIGEVAMEEMATLSTVSYKEDMIHLSCNFKLENAVILWDNYLLEKPFSKVAGNKISIKVPVEAKKKNRSYIRVWAKSEGGVTNDLLIPLDKGRIFSNTSPLDRFDNEAKVMYFLMVDRFNNAIPGNDQPLKDKAILPKANYMGGDLKGITNKIDDGFFHDLGINTLWISPIVRNPAEGYVEYIKPNRKYSGYHGYWPIASEQVDRRFGDETDFKTLVNEAHSKKINVLLDFVSNHVHENHPVYKKHPDWATPLKLPDGRQNIRLWDEQRLTTWFDTFLPSLNFDLPEVVEFQSATAIHWLDEYNLDGFRHDATKHIPESFWRDLTFKIKSTVGADRNRPVFQIGETFGTRELIGSYVNSGQMNGQFDFNLYFDARDVFGKDEESFERLNNSLMESFAWYGNHHTMGNITGNHDLPRFIAYAGEGLKWDEDPKEAGWERDIKVENPVGYKKLSQLMAFVMTIPGIPVIYYGDEYGMCGAGDPDNRDMMQFDNLSPEEKEVREITTKLTNIRRLQIPLVFGDFVPLQVEESSYVFARTYFDKIVVVAFNKSNNGAKLNVELPDRFKHTPLRPMFGNKVTRDKTNLNINLPGNSFEVLIVPLQFK